MKDIIDLNRVKESKNRARFEIPDHLKNPNNITVSSKTLAETEIADFTNIRVAFSPEFAKYLQTKPQLELDEINQCINKIVSFAVEHEPQSEYMLRHIKYDIMNLFW